MIKHTVKSGESLKVIAKRYGVTIDAILSINPRITDRDYIQAGWVLAIPEASDQKTDAPEVDPDTAVAKALSAALDAICALPEFQALEMIIRADKN